MCIVTTVICSIFLLYSNFFLSNAITQVTRPNSTTTHRISTLPIPTRNHTTITHHISNPTRKHTATTHQISIHKRTIPTTMLHNTRTPKQRTTYNDIHPTENTKRCTKWKQLQQRRIQRT